MPVNISLKDVPDDLVARLRARAARNHRSLRGELLSILEEAATFDAAAGARETGNLMDRLLAIAGDRGIDTAKRITREQAHRRARVGRSDT